MGPTKIYTEDDLHDLLGEAIEVVRERLRSADPYDRLAAAIRLLENPASIAMAKAQAAKDQFPNSLPEES